MDTLSCPPCHIPINLMVVVLRRGDFYSLCSGASEGRRVLCSKQDICIFISLILTAFRVRKLRQARNRVVYWIARVTTKDFRTLISSVQFSSFGYPNDAILQVKGCFFLGQSLSPHYVNNLLCISIRIINSQLLRLGYWIIPWLKNFSGLISIKFSESVTAINWAKGMLLLRLREEPTTWRAITGEEHEFWDNNLNLFTSVIHLIGQGCRTTARMRREKTCGNHNNERYDTERWTVQPPSIPG